MQNKLSFSSVFDFGINFERVNFIKRKKKFGNEIKMKKKNFFQLSHLITAIEAYNFEFSSHASIHNFTDEICILIGFRLIDVYAVNI